MNQEDKGDEDEDQLLLVETQITEILSRLSLEPSNELNEEFERLIKIKKNLKKNSEYVVNYGISWFFTKTIV